MILIYFDFYFILFYLALFQKENLEKKLKNGKMGENLLVEKIPR